jgi:hypothetical protein
MRSENLPDSQKDSKIDRKPQTQRPLQAMTQGWISLKALNLALLVGSTRR